MGDEMRAAGERKIANAQRDERVKLAKEVAFDFGCLELLHKDTAALGTVVQCFLMNRENDPDVAAKCIGKAIRYGEDALERLRHAQELVAEHIDRSRGGA